MANLGLFVLLGMVLALAACRWRVSLRLAAGILFFLGISPFRYYAMFIHPWGWYLLGLGIACSAFRVLAAHFRGFSRIIGPGLILMSVLIGTLAVGSEAWCWRRERYQQASLSPAPTGSSNVLLIVLDTVRTDDLSVYNYHHRTTPHLEQLAKHGVRFDRAFSTCSWTLPSHAGMFTGRLLRTHRTGSGRWTRPFRRLPKRCPHADISPPDSSRIRVIVVKGRD